MVATVLDQERQPLLGKKAPTPLPKLQLTIMCMLRMAEPILFQNIFAYINRMVEVLHIVDDPADVGWYSGLIESVFALAQLPMIYRWARLSDRIGRRPCVLISTSCAATAALLFGLSNSLATALVARAIAGLMAGNMSVVQSMVSEITDESNQARAYVIVDLVWYFGAILGTLIGGCLSEPVTQLPGLFGSSRFLAAFPFFLPCFAAFILAMSSVILGFFFLKETLPQRRDIQLQTTVNTAARHSAWSLLRNPAIASILAPHFLLSIQCIGFEVLFTLFSFTPVSLGGLNRSSFEIGVALAFGGVVAVVSYPIIFPALSARMPVKVFYLYIMALYPLCYLVTPLLNVAARALSVGEDTGGLTHEGKVVMWFLIGLLMLVARMGGMAFPAHSIFVRRAAPSQDSLGATFGLLHTVGATGRTLGPSIVSTLFAVTTSHNLLGGWFVWLVMGALGCVALLLAAQVRDGSMEPRETKDSCSEVDS